MLDALFGAELSLPVKFFVAFVVVLAIIGGAAYLVRRFGAGALNAAAAGRGRQPRLAVIDVATVDARRRLVLIRRDNIEHLIMIGGPSDLVIEPNIVRAAAAAPAREMPPARETPPAREAAAARPPAAITDILPRPVPLAEGGMWPLQPEPIARPQRLPIEGEGEEAAPEWSPPPEAPPRIAAESPPRPPAANSDRLAGLAADLSRNFHEPEGTPRRAAEPRRPQPVIAESDEQNLAEMAQRLETALQRPKAVSEAPPAAPAAARSAPAVAPAEPKAVRPEPKPVRSEPKPVRPEPRPEPRSEPKPVTKAAFDSLEQEMASLLGRPSGKT
jgi:flagellar protein FliO/FliZ